MHVGHLEVGRTWTRGGPRGGAWLSGAMTTQRHLAAILACDVVGYSRLMERDERGTLERLKIYRKDLLEPRVSEHRGRIVKLTGDGVLCEFASVVNAVTSAMAIQQAWQNTRRRRPRKSGFASASASIRRRGLRGERRPLRRRVNIAARLESIADPGTVVVSGCLRPPSGQARPLHAARRPAPQEHRGLCAPTRRDRRQRLRLHPPLPRNPRSRFCLSPTHERRPRPGILRRRAGGDIITGLGRVESSS